MKTQQHLFLAKSIVWCYLATAILTGCTTTSEEGMRGGFGLGFESSGQTTVEVSDQVAVAISKSAEAITKVGSFGDELTALAQNVTQTTEKTHSVDRAVAELKPVVDETKSRLNEIAALREKINDEVAKTSNELNTQQIEFRDRLAALSVEQRNALTEQVRGELAAAGVSADQIRELEAKAQEQGLSLIELLGTGGAGALGLGALLRTLGKSRGQSEIDELYDATKGIEVRVARIEELRSENKRLTDELESLKSRSKG